MNIIEELVKKSGKKLTQISKDTGIAYPTLSGYNQGIRTPKKRMPKSWLTISRSLYLTY